MGPTAVRGPIGADFRADCTYEEWCLEAEILLTAAKASLWWVGDAILYGEQRWGEDKVAQVFDPTDLALSYGTLRSARWVAERFAPSARWRALSWSHHREVAALAPEAAQGWLQMAVTESWSRDDLREARRSATIGGAALPGPGTITDGAYDSPVLGEAARMRFGLKLGGEVETFVKAWAGRYAPALARMLDG